MKLLLSSFGPSPEHDTALAELVGKPLGEIRVGYIENAHDVYDDAGSLAEGRESLRAKDYAFELVACVSGEPITAVSGRCSSASTPSSSPAATRTTFDRS